MSTIAEGVPPAEPMSPAQTVKLCQRMRLTQQMDAGVLSSDADYLCRIATELALGDPKRGIEPWVRSVSPFCTSRPVAHANDRQLS